VLETWGSRAGAAAVWGTWVAFAKALGDAVIQGDTAIVGGAVIQGDTDAVGVAIQGDTTVGVVIQGDTTVVVAIQGDTTVAVAIQGGVTVVPSTKALGGAANWLTVLFIAVGGCIRSLYSLAGIMANGDGVEPRWP